MTPKTVSGKILSLQVDEGSRSAPAFTDIELETSGGVLKLLAKNKTARRLAQERPGAVIRAAVDGKMIIDFSPVL